MCSAASALRRAIAFLLDPFIFVEKPRPGFSGAAVVVSTAFGHFIPPLASDVKRKTCVQRRKKDEKQDLMKF